MKVKELIEILNREDQEAETVISVTDHYSIYGKPAILFENDLTINVDMYNQVNINCHLNTADGKNSKITYRQ